MSADGEIEIAVNAEGVDDAAAELADGEGTPSVAAGGGDGEGGGGLSTAVQGGIVGGLLSQALGPLLDVLSPILKVLQAALAPLATMLLRLLSPVLRWLIQLLPGWMQFIDDLPEYVQQAIDWIQGLPGAIWDYVSGLPGDIWAEFAGLPGEIFGAFKGGINWLTDLPGRLATALQGLGVEILEGAENAIDTGAAIVDPRQGFRVKQLPSNIPFIGSQPPDPNDFSAAERRELRRVVVDLGFDTPEWLKARQRDQNTEGP